jgi:anti-sigma regulatory factor (Ser/Thr protein kinase)
MITYDRHAVTCWRDGSAWVVEVPRLGVSARAAHFSDVEEVARDLIVSLTREDPATCRVAVHLVARHTAAELVAAAAAVRQDPDEVSVEAVTLRRGLAQRLAAEGFSPRDVAALLGLSHVRALQLMNDRTSAALREAAAHRHPEPEQSSPSPVPRWPHPPPTRSGRPGASGRSTGEKPHTTYRHEAFLYRGMQDLLAGTVPFVSEGVAQGQAVMVAMVPERLEILREQVGAQAEEVCWVDMAELGGNPARIIPAWRQFVNEHGGGDRPVRGVGEPVWAGRRPAEVVECQLHEALLNLAVEPHTALWLRCPYDVDSLPDDVLTEASRSHPAIVEGGSYRGSTRYGGAAHAGDVFESALPEPATEVEEWEFGRPGHGAGPSPERDVAAVRHLAQDRAADAGLPHARRADLALAVTEAANNSVRYAGGRGTLRVWRDADSLICEIRDQGHIGDPLVGRHLPSLDRQGGRGLWLVNQLSDLVQIRSAAGGTAVRITNWL